LRANYNLKTPDSIQLASGIQKNADIFFTNDKNLKRVDKIEVLTLGEI
jgi:predicted nucleic acid-binding protein